MARALKITVIGAGSATFSMGLVKDLSLTQNLAGSQVSFMDIDDARLEMITKAAQRYVKELGSKLTFEKTTNLSQSLRDADFVINTAGAEYGHMEENRALGKKHGYYSGTGFGVNYYNMKLMMSVAREMEKVCPNAWLIQSGNPVYEGTNLMLRETSIKVIGLCHGHYGYFNIAKVMGLDPDKIRWIAPGLNHLIWLNEFRYDGQDAYPLLDEWIANKAEAYWQDRVDHPENYLDHVSGEEDQMSRAVIDQYRRFGLLPLGDTTRGGGWWYKTDLQTRLHWYGPTGGFGSDVHMPPFLKRHFEKVEKIHDVVSDPKKSVLEAFPPVKTREQQVPIIDALANDVQGYFQINVFNMGALPGVADNVVTEIPAIIDKGGIHRVQVNPLPKKVMLEVIQPSILSMEWQLEAFLKGDRRLWLEGLLMLNTYMSGGHTLTYQQAVDYMNDMFAQPWNREMAEHFK